MIYFGIKAVVIGDFILGAPIKSYHKGFEVSLFIEDGSYKISVIKPVPDNSPLQIHYKISADDSGPIIPDESAFKEYVELLQHIEAMGGYNYGITKILYNETLEIVWYSGECVFQNLHTIISASKHVNQSKKKILSQSNLSSILLLNKIIPDSIIPYNYFREANGYMQTESYRQAYIHFYMLLEFCFSKGATDKNKQVDDFTSNPDFVLALLQTINIFKEKNCVHYESIYSEVVGSDKNRAFSIKSITRLLFSYRGKLAHGIKRSASYVFNEARLKPVTLFISSVCFFVCGNMQVYCMSSKQYREGRVTQLISELKESLKVE